MANRPDRDRQGRRDRLVVLLRMPCPKQRGSHDAPSPLAGFVGPRDLAAHPRVAALLESVRQHPMLSEHFTQQQGAVKYVVELLITGIRRPARLRFVYGVLRAL